NPPPRLDAPARVARSMRAPAPSRHPEGGAPEAVNDPHSHMGLARVAFVQSHEVPERHRKALGGIERVIAELVLQPRDDESETELVKARLQKPQVIRQRRQFPLLLAGNLFEQRRDGGSHRHLSWLQCVRNNSLYGLKARG